MRNYGAREFTRLAVSNVRTFSEALAPISCLPPIAPAKLRRQLSWTIDAPFAFAPLVRLGGGFRSSRRWRWGRAPNDLVARWREFPAIADEDEVGVATFAAAEHPAFVRNDLRVRPVPTDGAEKSHGAPQSHGGVLARPVRRLGAD